jgi:hypothetical protein
LINDQPQRRRDHQGDREDDDRAQRAIHMLSA